ncbi:hypothetical protein EJB05_26541, partial [Eragrostis curvula]
MGATSSSSAASVSSAIRPTIISETITGAHILKIDRYSDTKGIGVGVSVNSEVFTVGGHQWYIQCFPEGSLLECAGWISVFLHLDHPAVNMDDDVRAKFEFYLLDKYGEPVLNYLKVIPVCTFSLVAGFPPARWGCRKFIRRKTFEWWYLTQDVLRIRCNVTVVKEASVGTSTVRPETPAVPPSLVAAHPDLQHHLGDLLASRLGADVTFMVSGELFPAHRIVLAVRSSVFKAELFGHMKEKDMAYIQIDEMDPNVFRAMLHFIYTDALPEIDDRDNVAIAQHLIVAADRYDLEKLKIICTDILLSRADATNVVTTLVLAEQHGFTALKEACFRFIECIGNRKVALMASDSFQHLRISCPALFEEVLAKLPNSPVEVQRNGWQ